MKAYSHVHVSQMTQSSLQGASGGNILVWAKRLGSLHEEELNNPLIWQNRWAHSHVGALDSPVKRELKQEQAYALLFSDQQSTCPA